MILVAGMALVAPLAAGDGEIVWGGSVPLTGIYAQAGKLGSMGVWRLTSPT